jgi:chromosome segregation ATPase
LIAELKKALSKEKAARSAADQALAEEKATRQTVEQSFLSSNEANTLLARELDSTRASLNATTEKLSSKSSTLDYAVIQEQQMKIQLTVCEEKLTTCEEKLAVANDKLKADEEKIKTQGQLLDSAQQALFKQELLSSIVISSTVANVVALMKNHLPDLDMEILRNDFTVNDTGQKILVNSAYDAAHDFVSLYDFSSLAESDDDNNSPGAL